MWANESRFYIWKLFFLKAISFRKKYKLFESLAVASGPAFAVPGSDSKFFAGLPYLLKKCEAVFNLSIHRYRSRYFKRKPEFSSWLPIKTFLEKFFKFTKSRFTIKTFFWRPRIAFEFSIRQRLLFFAVTIRYFRNAQLPRILKF